MRGPSSSSSYDVIIAGASFAGLAAAHQIRRGRVLLVDRQPIGEGVTSACAAPARIVEMAGAAASIQQVHEALIIHTPGGPVTWPLPEPFCTFDYRTFCLEAAARARIGEAGGVEFRLASVLGREGRRVLTSAGAFDGRLLVDATGPRAALAGAGRPRHVAFGLESEIDLPVEPGLHFYFVPEIRDGYAWAFPCGGATRFGVLSYRGRTKLRPALERFMARFGATPGGIHGGYLATGWTSGSTDGVLVAGDAAGHCLPLSGEGIRTAVLAGARCGELIQQVLDGILSHDEAAAAFGAYVGADRRRYRGLLGANALLLALPQRWVGRAASLLALPRARRWFFEHYLGIGTRIDTTMSSTTQQPC
jgi:flavin-dependent dehydrogenase